MNKTERKQIKIYVTFILKQDFVVDVRKYEGVSKSIRTESITRYTLATISTHWEATQRVMAAKLTRLNHRTAIQLYLVVESCIICSSLSRRPVRKLLDTPLYVSSSCSWTCGSGLIRIWRSKVNEKCKIGTKLEKLKLNTSHCAIFLQNWLVTKFRLQLRLAALSSEMYSCLTLVGFISGMLCNMLFTSYINKIFHQHESCM